MHRWVQNFRWQSLLSDLKSKLSKSPSPPCPAPEHCGIRNQPNTLSPYCPCRVRLAKAADIPNIVQFVRGNFLHHEPLCRSLYVSTLPSEAELLDYIRALLHDSFTLLALANADSDRIVGVAISRRSCPWDGKQLIERADRTRCNQLRKLLYIWSIVEAEPNLHQHFCTRCLFEIAFLATALDSQRQGVGLHLTQRSLVLARDLGFHFARMNCTCEYSSRVATKAGLECHWTVAYHHLVDSVKQPVVRPDPPHTHIRVHAMNLFPDRQSCPLNPHAGN